MSDDIASLPLGERGAHYRKMALDALGHAQAAQDGVTREKYLNLARSWHALAVKIEEGLAKAAAQAITPRSATTSRLSVPGHKGNQPAIRVRQPD